MIRAALLSFLLSGCAGAECVTTCGLHAADNCAELQAVEASVIRNFGRFVDNWTETEVCAALAGWTVEAHVSRPSDAACGGDGAWIAAPGLCVIGYTHEGAHRVELTSDHWKATVIAHELVHVIDLVLYHRAGHCRWLERGIKRALLEITGQEDQSVPESTCAD